MDHSDGGSSAERKAYKEWLEKKRVGGLVLPDCVYEEADTLSLEEVIIYWKSEWEDKSAQWRTYHAAEAYAFAKEHGVQAYLTREGLNL